MEIEQTQSEFIEMFVKQGQTARGSDLVKVINSATSHPSLFAFSEILSCPNVVELQGTEFANSLDLLRLFAHGTWNDYKSNVSQLPILDGDQVRKLKQLTVLTLAETSKVLPYDLLMQQLDVSNVRELEDFLINECMYSGIVKGKLDQWRRCFEVQFAAGRDLRPGQLDNMIQRVANWLNTSDGLLSSIQEKIHWADKMSELDRKHAKEVEEKTEEAKSNLKAALRGNEELSYFDSTGVMDYEEERSSRPKRRR